MMLKVAEYRQHAADCRRMAKTTKDPDQRKMLEDMAASWDSLAHERDQFLKLQMPATAPTPHTNPREQEADRSERLP